MTDEQEHKTQPMSELDKARLRYYQKGASFFSNMNAIIILTFLLAIGAALLYFGMPHR